MDIIGKKFNRLTVLSEYKKGNRTYCTCKCDCGNIKEVRKDNVESGSIKSCGCLKIETASTHRMTHSRIYNIWNRMKERCYNPKNPSYQYYGEKGIKVCKEWEYDFMNFYKWSMENGYKEMLSIDRIDNSKDYFPENCRWVEMADQQRNKSNNIFYKYKGMKKCLSEWARYFGMSDSALRWRLKRMSFIDAISKKNLKNKIFVTLNGVRKTCCEWCKELGISRQAIDHLVQRHKISYEEAFDKKLNYRYNPCTCVWEKTK